MERAIRLIGLAGILYLAYYLFVNECTDLLVELFQPTKEAKPDA